MNTNKLTVEQLDALELQAKTSLKQWFECDAQTALQLIAAARRGLEWKGKAEFLAMRISELEREIDPLRPLPDFCNKQAESNSQLQKQVDRLEALKSSNWQLLCDGKGHWMIATYDHYRVGTWHESPEQAIDSAIAKETP